MARKTTTNQKTPARAATVLAPRPVRITCEVPADLADRISRATTAAKQAGFVFQVDDIVQRALRTACRSAERELSANDSSHDDNSDLDALVEHA